MSGTDEWELLHDATLKTIAIDWQSGVARFDFAPSMGEAKFLFAYDLARIVIPRELPWGASSSVNRADLSRANDAEPTAVEIEMQSGDVIIVEARRLSLTANQEH